MWLSGTGRGGQGGTLAHYRVTSARMTTRDPAKGCGEIDACGRAEQTRILAPRPPGACMRTV